MKIFVFIKNVYGNELIYPACNMSKLFASLMGRKTLTREAISIIKEMGYAVELVTEKSDL